MVIRTIGMKHDRRFGNERRTVDRGPIGGAERRVTIQRRMLDIAHHSFAEWMGEPGIKADPPADIDDWVGGTG